MKYQDIIIEMPLESKVYDVLKEMKAHNIFKGNNVLHFVSIYCDSKMRDMLPVNMRESDLEDKRKFIESRLDELKNVFTKKNSKVETVCILHSDTRIKSLEYIDEIKPNLLVLFEHKHVNFELKKHFTEYILENVSCDVFVKKLDFY